MNGLLQIPEHVAHEREKRTAKRSFTRCYLSLFFFLLFVEVLIVGVQILGLLFLGEELTVELLANPYVQYGLQVLIMYILGFPFFLLLNLGMQKSVYEKKKMGVGSFIVYLLIAQFLMQAGAMVSSIISETLYSIIPTGGSGDSVVGGFIDEVPWWLVIAVVVVIGPIFEELMFRKVLFDRLSVYGDRLAVLISAVAFGLFHGNIEQLIYATAIGLLFGSIYAKTRNIWHTIFLHMAVNFLGTVPGLIAANSMEKIFELSELGSLLTEAEAASSVFHFVIIAIISILQIGMSIAGLVLFIVFMVKKKLIPEKRCRIRLEGKTLSRCVIANAGAILLLIYCTAQIVLSLIFI